MTRIHMAIYTAVAMILGFSVSNTSGDPFLGAQLVETPVSRRPQIAEPRVYERKKL